MLQLHINFTFIDITFISGSVKLSFSSLFSQLFFVQEAVLISHRCLDPYWFGSHIGYFVSLLFLSNIQGTAYSAPWMVGALGLELLIPQILYGFKIISEYQGSGYFSSDLKPEPALCFFKNYCTKHVFVIQWSSSWSWGKSTLILKRSNWRMVLFSHLYTTLYKHRRNILSHSVQIVLPYVILKYLNMTFYMRL